MRHRSAVAIASALILAACAGPNDPGVRYIGSFSWQMQQPWFGGLSGLELTDDGLGMLVLTDKAHLLEAKLQRENDQIIGVIAGESWQLKSSAGKPLAGRILDAEGLAVMPDGSICVSFEAVHRVACYLRPDAPAVPLARPPAFRNMSPNGSLEALAVDPQGRLYTLPEEDRNPDGSIPVYRWANGHWSQPFSLPARGKFLPVGADFGPDGTFYLLERAFGGIGFRTRVRRWQITEDGPQDEQTLLTTGLGAHDNLEGLSVWRDDQDRIRLTMVADDNFNSIQRTELVEYALTE